MAYEDILTDLGINSENIPFEKMNPVEKQTVYDQIDAIENNRLTPDGLREGITKMLRSVEQELIQTPEYERFWLFFIIPNRKHVLLKARMENYMLILALFENADAARKQLEVSLGRVNKKR